MHDITYPEAEVQGQEADLNKAKSLALLEVRAIGPVTKASIEGWLIEQGGEEVADLAGEAIQSLLDEGKIEVWDLDEQEPAYGYCGRSVH